MWKGTSTHVTSVEGLREWEILKSVSEEELLQVKALYVFKTRRHVACPGGKSAAIYLTSNDVAYGLGHNCQNVNFLGLTVDGEKMLCLPHNVDTPLAIPGLSGQGVIDIAVGGIVCAAVTSAGRLLRWGRCPAVSTPHTPPGSAEISFKKVVCGDRMVVALTSMYNVYVWGTVDPTTSTTLEGVRIEIESPVADVACGLFHAALVDLDGIVYTWSRRDIDGYVAKRLGAGKCFDVKCGPRSTFCLTENRRVKTCGILPQMVDVGLSNVKEMAVVRSDYDGATVVVATSALGRIYTWGGNATTQPQSRATSFLREFARLGATPNLIYVHLHPTPSRLCEAYRLSEPFEMPRTFRPRSGRIVAIRPRPVPDLLMDVERQPAMPPVECPRTITSFDVLTYLYLRDRTDLADQLDAFLRSKPYAEIAKRVPESFVDDVDGREFIMSKFLSSVEAEKRQLFV